MNNIGDIFLDTIIREALIANIRDEMNALPSEEELREKYPPSPEHVRKMKKLFAWERRRDFRKRVMPITKAAAVFLCVATTILFSALMFSPEVRAAVHGTIVRFFEGFAQVEFSEPVVEDRTSNSFTLGYILDGYELISREEVGYGIFEIYSDDEGNLLFFTLQPSDSPALDIDHREYRTETHLGIDFHIFESLNVEYDTNIVWEQDSFIFSLTGIILVNELLEMALSVE